MEYDRDLVVHVLNAVMSAVNHSYDLPMEGSTKGQRIASVRAADMYTQYTITGYRPTGN